MRPGAGSATTPVRRTSECTRTSASSFQSTKALNHQIVDTFATVVESDLSWTEKIWLSIPKKDGSLQIDFGLGRYQNRNVMDGFAGISRGNEQWTVRASRELAERSRPGRRSVRISYEVVEPLSKVRIRLDENDVLPLTFDVTFEKKLPPYFEDRHAQRDEHGFRIVSNVVRYHQGGTISGWVAIDGKKEDVRPDDWFAFRDHSWGVRLDVGAPVTDLRPARDFGDRVARRLVVPPPLDAAAARAPRRHPLRVSTTTCRCAAAVPSTSPAI